MSRKRLDICLTEAGLTESREKAQAVIRAGLVRVNDQRIDKPSAPVLTTDRFEIIAQPRFVSRGGDKLEAAFEGFKLSVHQRVCIDVGASTGGFTDCMLQHGAKSVYAIDVGKGQLHWQLRNDPRVIVMEGLNARGLDCALFDPRPSFASVDVSFISLTKILPALIDVLEPGSECVTLIKPQFEAGREQVGRGGVVRDEAVREAVINRVREFGESRLGLAWKGVIESPVRGPAGNVEFLAHWQKKSGEHP